MSRLDVECHDIVDLVRAIECVASDPDAALIAMKELVSAGMFDGFVGFLKAKHIRKLNVSDARSWDRLTPGERERILNGVISGLADSVADIQDDLDMLRAAKAPRMLDSEISKAIADLTPEKLEAFRRLMNEWRLCWWNAEILEAGGIGDWEQLARAAQEWALTGQANIGERSEEKRQPPQSRD